MSEDEARAHMALARQELKGAKVLLDAGLPAVSVGRSYYAMFHAGQALLARRGTTTRTHRGFLLELQKLNQQRLLPAALLRAVAEAQRLREKGDYDGQAQISHARAAGCLAEAEEVVERMESLLDAGQA